MMIANPFRRSKRAAARAVTGGAGAWGVANTAAVSIPSDLLFESVSHNFGETSVLDDVSLSAAPGTVTCLLGPSGSGKTTLLRIAAGMEIPTSGRVLSDGSELTGPGRFVPPEKRGIGLVFQDYALFPHLTIGENVMFGLSGTPTAGRRKQALAMLDRVGLQDRFGDSPASLSGGEQQRVALARALAPRPGILLMDEPFSGLDSRLRDAMREETLAVLRETRATSLVVTHDPEEAMRMGDRIVLLCDGRVEQIGTARELYRQPASLFAAAFFSEVNTLPASVSAGSARTPLGIFETPLPDGPAILSVRVAGFDVSPAETGNPGTAARVLRRDFAGDVEHLRVGISGFDEPLTIKVPATGPRAIPDAARNLLVAPRVEAAFIFPTDPSPATSVVLRGPQARTT